MKRGGMTIEKRRKILAKALLAELGLFVWAATALFGLAGTILWLAAWLFLFLFFGFVTGLATYLYWHDPELLAERMTVLKADQFAWDKVWISLFYSLSALWFTLMPIDRRWHLSHIPGQPIWLQSVGVLLLLGSETLIFFAVRENAYASPVVRIQQGHKVIDTGLYALVRHPLYTGAILFYLGVPLLLGSGYGLAFSTSVFIEMLWVRTQHEEETLRRFLPDYEAYMRRVRWRFIPGIY